MADDCTKLVVDADGTMELVKVDFWEFTGIIRCRHCGHIFHNGTKQIPAKTAQVAWELLKAAIRH